MMSGVYGMWNIYIFGLLFLYAPSHKTWGNEDTHSTGEFGSLKKKSKLEPLANSVPRHLTKNNNK
jgi:hypothetical protein